MSVQRIDPFNLRYCGQSDELLRSCKLVYPNFDSCGTILIANCVNHMHDDAIVHIGRFSTSRKRRAANLANGKSNSQGTPAILATVTNSD